MIRILTMKLTVRPRHRPIHHILYHKMRGNGVSNLTDISLNNQDEHHV
jgi:hypothetical protein